MSDEPVKVEKPDKPEKPSPDAIAMLNAVAAMLDKQTGPRAAKTYRNMAAEVRAIAAKLTAP